MPSTTATSAPADVKLYAAVCFVLTNAGASIDDACAPAQVAASTVADMDDPTIDDMFDAVRDALVADTAVCGSIDNAIFFAWRACDLIICIEDGS